ncbi:outer membrane protein TolC [Tenacibaculum skagerrakense]|uniref:Outer membrane protein TolC n=1 Tax=Tenacibaculum skagerrakense TaxID=186571 RepID=A0A4R2NUJ0_9FLAO|nr:TolC family protein [Tenacibaculum skagerrakense]TCP25174.1 outer membrane protein TolC [Tenacibaculum skagerrakense]
MRAIVFISLFSFLIGFSQQKSMISKKEVLQKVHEGNSSLKITNQEYLMAKADFNQSRAVFLPNITASHTGILTTNPLMAFGSKLNQEILTQNDFDPARLNDPNETRNFATVLEIQQPLINIDGIYKRKASKVKMEAIELKTSRTKEYLTLEVNKAYMQLQLSYRGVEVLEKALTTAEANKQLAENSFKQGFLQESDVLAVDVHVTEVKNQLQTAKSNVLNASNYLSFLMNERGDVVYQPADSLTINISKELSKAVSNDRSDIKAMELSTEAYKKMYQSEKMSFLPRLNAFGSYQLFDNNIFNVDASGYLVGAQLSWDIFQGSKRFAKVQKSKAEYEKSVLEYQQYKSKSELELNKVLRMLHDAENKLKLTELAMQQSKEALRIRKNRFKEGLEKSTDLLIAETKYIQKQLEYYQTIFEFNYSKAYVEFLTK